MAVQLATEVCPVTAKVQHVILGENPVAAQSFLANVAFANKPTGYPSLIGREHRIANGPASLGSWRDSPSADLHQAGVH